MANTSKIEWTDSTFNPWIGCTKVSPACDHCYAAVSTPSRTLGVEWGSGKPRHRTSAANWRQPLRWNRADFQQCVDCGWRGEVDTLASDQCPACGKHQRLDPARRRVFCASLADVFDNEVDPQWRADLFALIEATPNLDWLLLTKRVGNVAKMLDDVRTELQLRGHEPMQWPWPNIWLGATICNQAEADRDVPKLLRVPAAVRFLSIEPMLGPVDLNAVPPPEGVYPVNGATVADISGCLPRWQTYPMRAKLRSGVDWIIAGGESGSHARPAHPEWFRSLRDQCAAARVPFLFKQWGEWGEAPPVAERRGWDPTSGREHLFQDGPEDKHTLMLKVGKLAAGRMLDGVLHDGYPA